MSDGRELGAYEFQLHHTTRPPTPEERRTAQLVCAGHAHNADDLRDLLTLLGLLTEVGGDANA